MIQIGKEMDNVLFYRDAVQRIKIIFACKILNDSMVLTYMPFVSVSMTPLVNKPYENGVIVLKGQNLPY